MFRYCFAALALAATISMVGCCAGPGCGSCNDCGGWGAGTGPFDHIRAWRRSMLCGDGCGGVYRGEWRSYPPDCEEPCPDFGCGETALACGGCGACDGCCPRIRPLQTVARFAVALYGKRCCEGCGYGFDDCCCEGPVEVGCGCGGGCAGGDCAVPVGSQPLLQTPTLASSSQEMQRTARSPQNMTRTARAPAVRQASPLPTKRQFNSLRR